MGTAFIASSVATITTGSVNNARVSDAHNIPPVPKVGLGSFAEGYLKALLGENFIPLKDSNVCCGFGGSYSVDFAGISRGVLEKKIENIKATNADMVLTDCPGCVMQIEGGLLKMNENIKVMHLSNFFEEYMVLKEPEML